MLLKLWLKRMWLEPRPLWDEFSNSKIAGWNFLIENSAFGETKQADFPAHTCILFFSIFFEKAKVWKSGFNEKMEFEKQLEKIYIPIWLKFHNLSEQVLQF